METPTLKALLDFITSTRAGLGISHIDAVGAPLPGMALPRVATSLPGIAIPRVAALSHTIAPLLVAATADTNA